MSLSTVLFLFLAHLGVGIVFSLTLVSREAGVKFFRFNAGLASILLVIALAFGFTSVSRLTIADLIVPGDSRGGIGAVTVDFGLNALVISTAAIVLYWA